MRGVVKRTVVAVTGTLLAATGLGPLARAADPPPPGVSITSSPGPTSRAAQATFRFTGSNGATSFVCALDGVASACTSPHTVTVGDGSHRFTVSPMDGGGRAGAPASAGWTVDTLAPPAPRIDSAPPEFIAQPQATLGFSGGGGPGESFQCRIDIGAFTACASPKTFTGLSDGWHTFSVRAVDLVGPGPSSTVSSTVDTVAPTISLSPPSDLDRQRTPQVGLNANETVAFHCSLDGGPTAPCSSPWSPSWLDPGPHALDVVGVDRAGNVSALAPLRWTFTGPSGTPGAGATPPSPAGAVPAAPGTIPPTSRRIDPARAPSRTRLALLSPFPIVRIAGTVQGRGVIVRTLTVRAPRVATTTVRCRGRGCPKRSARVPSSAKGPSPVRWLAGARLRTGAVIEIRVTQPNRIGKFTKFVVQRGRPPARIDACLRPGRQTPVSCPAS